MQERLNQGIKEGDHLLYILKVSNENEIFYKIGRTSYTIEERYKNSIYSIYKMEPVFKLYGDKEYIKVLERKLLDITRNDYTKPLRFNEHTECRSKLNKDIVKYIKENYDYKI